MSVEVDVSPGLPGVIMVGLPDATVRESRDRVRSAIRNSGFPFPGDRVVVSLAPADLRKVGAAFDLPIALGILAASGVLPHRDAAPLTVVGGLSLDGRVPPMNGLLPIAVAVRGQSHARLMFPGGNLAEAGIVRDVSVVSGRLALGGGADSSPRPPQCRRRLQRLPSRMRLPPVRISRTSEDSSSPGARSKSPPPAATTCS